MQLNTASWAGITTDNGANNWNWYFGADGNLIVPSQIVPPTGLNSTSSLDLVTNGANTAYLGAGADAYLYLVNNEANLYGASYVRIITGMGEGTQFWTFDRLAVVVKALNGGTGA